VSISLEIVSTGCRTSTPVGIPGWQLKVIKSYSRKRHRTQRVLWANFFFKLSASFLHSTKSLKPRKWTKFQFVCCVSKIKILIPKPNRESTKREIHSPRSQVKLDAKIVHKEISRLNPAVY
jgi:hypothetical protein